MINKTEKTTEYVLLFLICDSFLSVGSRRSRYDLSEGIQCFFLAIGLSGAASRMESLCNRCTPRGATLVAIVFCWSDFLEHLSGSTI